MDPQRDLAPVAFADLKGWESDDHLAAFNAFCASAEQILAGRYKPRPFNMDLDALTGVARVALEQTVIDTPQAKAFFEQYFSPWRIEHPGFLTGFFEPIVPASPMRTETFSVPLLRRPKDLLEIDDDNRPAGWDEATRFGRQTATGIEPYADRSEIHRLIRDGALDDEALCWLSDPVDAFFIHVQGAAKLDVEPALAADNPARYLRVTYDGKSGHAYRSIAKLLCGKLDIEPANMTADRLADWLRQNPQERAALIEQNRSYIFFRAVPGLDPQIGPVAAAKVPLHPGRSLAVDRLMHTFGTPFWLAPETPLPGEETAIPRLTIAHDTGSAIVGPARADLFAGSGAEAGLRAGKIRHAATLTMLLPRGRS